MVTVSQYKVALSFSSWHYHGGSYGMPVLKVAVKEVNPGESAIRNAAPFLNTRYAHLPKGG